MKPTPMKYFTRSVQYHSEMKQKYTFFFFFCRAHIQTPNEISTQSLSGVIQCLKGLVLDV